MHSMQLQPPVLRVPTNKPICKPTGIPLVETTNYPTGKPTRALGIKPTILPANLSKCKRLRKWQAPHFAMP